MTGTERWEREIENSFTVNGIYKTKDKPRPITNDLAAHIKECKKPVTNQPEKEGVRFTCGCGETYLIPWSEVSHTQHQEKGV